MSKSGGEVRGRSRGARVRVKTARGRKLSSTRWLQRQLNDPYVAAAQASGYRSRAAFKLREIDDEFRLLGKARSVLDLGAAPGGWLQVALERTKAGAHLVGVDVLSIEPLSGVTFIEGDLTQAATIDQAVNAMNGPADVVLSDMAAPTTGHRQTDHLRTMALCSLAADVAEEVLTENGAFICKVFQGGTDGELLARLKRRFAKVKHVKPPASRKGSSEWYVVAKGFRPDKDSRSEEQPLQASDSASKPPVDGYDPLA